MNWVQEREKTFWELQQAVSQTPRDRVATLESRMPAGNIEMATSDDLEYSTFLSNTFERNANAVIAQCRDDWRKL